MLLDIPLPLGYALGVLLFLVYFVILLAQRRRRHVLQLRAEHRARKELLSGWEPGL